MIYIRGITRQKVRLGFHNGIYHSIIAEAEVLHKAPKSCCTSFFWRRGRGIILTDICLSGSCNEVLRDEIV
ncbi:hypothetical protein DSUL_50426 [Desulfovibrionales bacterium]